MDGGRKLLRRILVPRRIRDLGCPVRESEEETMGEFLFSIDDQNKVLKLLAKATGRSRRADVVRDALAVYQYLAGRAMEGQRIFLGEDKENATELDITTFRGMNRAR